MELGKALEDEKLPLEDEKGSAYATGPAFEVDIDRCDASGCGDQRTVLMTGDGRVSQDYDVSCVGGDQAVKGRLIAHSLAKSSKKPKGATDHLNRADRLHTDNGRRSFARLWPVKDHCRGALQAIRLLEIFEIDLKSREAAHEVPLQVGEPISSSKMHDNAFYHLRSSASTPRRSSPPFWRMRWHTLGLEERLRQTSRN